MGCTVSRGIFEQGEFARHDFHAAGSDTFNVLIIFVVMV